MNSILPILWRFARDFADFFVVVSALVFATLFFTGCTTRSVTRYNAAGEPWSKESLTLFLVRGEASQVSEKIVETGSGDYTREVSIGDLSGQSETDKLTDLVNAVNRLKSPAP